jgi:hypothetical protein
LDLLFRIYLFRQPSDAEEWATGNDGINAPLTPVQRIPSVLAVPESGYPFAKRAGQIKPPNWPVQNTEIRRLVRSSAFLTPSKIVSHLERFKGLRS